MNRVDRRKARPSGALVLLRVRVWKGLDGYSFVPCLPPTSFTYIFIAPVAHSSPNPQTDSLVSASGYVGSDMPCS